MINVVQKIILYIYIYILDIYTLSNMGPILKLRTQVYHVECGNQILPRTCITL